MDQLIAFITWFIKYFLPPMIANASPLLVKGDKRIDGGVRFFDKKPLFGQNKTWEGFLIGVYMGFSTSIAISIIVGQNMLALIGLGASIAALIGDLLGSFIKRRLDIKSGDPLPVVDQLDFALAVIAYYYLIGLVDVVTKPTYILYTLLIILVLHIITNNIAYYIGVKNKRW